MDHGDRDEIKSELTQQGQELRGLAERLESAWSDPDDLGELERDLDEVVTVLTTQSVRVNARAHELDGQLQAELSGEA